MQSYGAQQRFVPPLELRQGQKLANPSSILSQLWLSPERRRLRFPSEYCYEGRPDAGDVGIWSASRSASKSPLFIKLASVAKAIGIDFDDKPFDSLATSGSGSRYIARCVVSM